MTIKIKDKYFKLTVILLVIVLIVLVLPKLKPITKEKGLNPETASEQDNGTAPDETRFFRIAFDFMEGKGGEGAKGITPPEDPVTAEPTGCNVETNLGFEYFYLPSEERYVMPIENIPGAGKRKVVEVSCEFGGYPYNMTVFIDPLNDKIVDWRLGQD